MTAPSPQLSSPARTALRTATIVDYQSFLDLEPEWNRLVDTVAPDHPFLEHAWVRTWWECFGSGSSLHIVVVKSGGETIAIAPLILTTVRMFGVPVRRLGFFYNSHVPRADFLVARRHREAYRAILEHIEGSRDWDVLQLCQLAHESETLHEIRRLAGPRCRMGTWLSGASPYVPMDRSWVDYMDGLPAKHRSNLRNRLKRLREAGEVELETIRSADAPAIEEALEIEAAAWKGESGTAISSDPETARFYRLLAGRAARRGWLRLHFLRCGNTRAAFDYSLAYANRIHLLKVGYDPAYSPYSPSNLLLHQVLEKAFEEGASEYDFLGECAEWKMRWTRLSKPYCWLFVFSRSAKGRALYFAKFTLVPLWKRWNAWLRRHRRES